MNPSSRNRARSVTRRIDGVDRKHRAALKRVPRNGREDERRSDAGFKRPLGLVEAPGVLDGHFLRSFVQPGNAPARMARPPICAADFDSAVAPRSADSRRTEYEGTREAMRWLVHKGFSKVGLYGHTKNEAELS